MMHFARLHACCAANIDRFEDKDFQVLRVLLKLLEASREVRAGLTRDWLTG